MKTSTQLPLDQLREPEDDVRTHRPPEQIRSIADSLGDPDVGQLQPILAYPVGWDDLDIDSADDLDQLIRDGHEFEIVDGTTRYYAAKDFLQWDRLWTWIWDSPPESLTVARLDANTERITMTEFETVRAVVSHKHDTGKTWQEVSEETGWSPSYLAYLGTCMDGPEWLVEAWQDPEIHVETSHVTRIMKGIGTTFQEAIVDQGGKEPHEAESIAHRMGQRFVEWTHEYEYAPKQLEDSIKAKQDEILRDLQDGRSLEEQQRDAERATAAAQDGVSRQDQAEEKSCVVCGGEWTTLVAVPVCDQDRGLLNDHVPPGKQLLAPEEPAETSTAPADGVDPTDAVQTLVEHGVDADALQSFLKEQS